MNARSKLVALSIAVGVLAAAAVAQARDYYFPHDKPIDTVIYYTDGTADPVIYGVEVHYCDLTTYRDGSLTGWPQFVPYNEC